MKWLYGFGRRRAFIECTSVVARVAAHGRTAWMELQARSRSLAGERDLREWMELAWGPGESCLGAHRETLAQAAKYPTVKTIAAHRPNIVPLDQLKTYS